LFGSAKRILSKIAQGAQTAAAFAQHPIVSSIAGMSGGMISGAGGMGRRRR
jgi:hypothetical protein